jgi:hypothetical protein
MLQVWQQLGEFEENTATKLVEKFTNSKKVSLSAVYCLLSAVCWLLSDVFCLLSAV